MCRTQCKAWGVPAFLSNLNNELGRTHGAAMFRNLFHDETFADCSAARTSGTARACKGGKQAKKEPAEAGSKRRGSSCREASMHARMAWSINRQDHDPTLPKHERCQNIYPFKNKRRANLRAAVAIKGGRTGTACFSLSFQIGSGRSRIRCAAARLRRRPT